MIFVKLPVVGYKKPPKNDNEPDYEAMGIKRPASEEEESIIVDVAIRLDTILYVKDYTVEKDYCLLGTDYNAEYIINKSLDDVVSVLESAS